MKKVVYFIGAGFSVPAGLPMISNFIFRAKNQYFSDQRKYLHFETVFKYIDSLSKAKNYTNVDLFNVEEVFSIADTHMLLGHTMKKDIEQFIKDVIIYYTPVFEKTNKKFDARNGSFHALFSDNVLHAYYIGFFCSLMNLKFISKIKPYYEHSDFNVNIGNSSDKYSIVTLNYDNIVENSINYINEHFSAKVNMPIAKLHGSVSNRIIPPTWNKTINNLLNEDWQNAAKWLSEANEIRILGYSLPSTDMYIKHLFSTSLLESKNLQKIDVLCLDCDGAVKSRYDEMFTFPNYDFYNVDITTYINRFTMSGSTSINHFMANLSTEKIHEERLRS